MLIKTRFVTNLVLMSTYSYAGGAIIIFDKKLDMPRRCCNFISNQWNIFCTEPGFGHGYIVNFNTVFYCKYIWIYPPFTASVSSLKLMIGIWMYIRTNGHLCEYWYPTCECRMRIYSSVPANIQHPCPCLPLIWVLVGRPNVFWLYWIMINLACFHGLASYHERQYFSHERLKILNKSD